MPRRNSPPKRKPLPDAKYGNELVARFINAIMVDGKKSIAEKIMYEALENLKAKASKTVSADEDESGDEGAGSAELVMESKDIDAAIKYLQKVIDNVRPRIEVKSRRVGGATYQVPVEVKADRAIALAMRWIIAAAKSRSEKGMAKQLSAEFLDALENKGTSVKKREDTHKMAEANKAFAHFRW